MRGMGDIHSTASGGGRVAMKRDLAMAERRDIGDILFPGHRPKVSRLSSGLNPSTEQPGPSPDLTLEALDPPSHSMANVESHTHEELEVKLFL